MAEGSTILQPGVPIKPKVSEADVKQILSDVYGLECLSVKELNGYDDSNYLVKVNEIYSNNYIDSINKDGYILKVINSLESKKPHFFEAQTEVLIHLGKRGIACPKPILDKNGQYYSIHKFASGEHLVRLLQFINGLILHHVPSTVDLFYEVGQFVARLDTALKDFHHPVYDSHRTVWMLDSVPELNKFLFAINNNQSRRQLVERVVEEFSKRVLSQRSNLEEGMIHGDFNEQNILVEQKNSKFAIKAVLDFGDCHFGCYVYEVAITMTYMIIEGNSIDVGGHVLAGYTSIRKLRPAEFNLLKVCIAGRLCQSLVMGAYSFLQDPENSYILSTAKAGWSLLEELWAQPEDKLLERWKKFYRC